jgi:hypothetical protein
VLKHFTAGGVTLLVGLCGFIFDPLVWGVASPRKPRNATLLVVWPGLRVARVDGQRMRLRDCCVADGQFDRSARGPLLRLAGEAAEGTNWNRF